MPGRAFVITLGCPKNLADSEEMAGCLVRSGWILVDSPDDADLVLLNTCAFLRCAVEESVEALVEAIQWKSGLPGRLLVLAGCLPGRYEWDPADANGEIDLVIGPADAAGLARFLGSSPGAPAY
ncbi:30S ribosomal protein S12 methylthiotransferase RimO, partial [Candidatus Fermentibacterales bacterium]|nr:30S ribosomal protein S12 methylthiotransferase RimO [Candidatus Fermentibacterales bacterium]